MLSGIVPIVAGGGPAFPALPPRAPALRAVGGQARAIIALYMTGGPSHIDTFDYKPLLRRLHGQSCPREFSCPATSGRAPRLTGGGQRPRLLAGPWTWRQHGRSGLWFSSLLPHLAGHADRLCMVHSMQSRSDRHAVAANQLFEQLLGDTATRSGEAGSPPCEVPRHVSLLLAPPRLVPSLGELVVPAEMAPRSAAASTARRTTSRPCSAAHRAWWDARVDDLARETRRTQTLYGLDGPPEPARFGRLCLLARRAVERGVRLVLVHSAADAIGWDAHGDLAGNHRASAAQVDQPIAALLDDLHRRGMLDETLVLWASEFGRSPCAQNGHGRDHNPQGFTIWLAGGGVGGGQRIGATDEIGMRAVDSPCVLADLLAPLHVAG